MLLQTPIFSIDHLFLALLFYYGATLAASHQFSVSDITLVFTELLFSIAHVSAIVAFSMASYYFFLDLVYALTVLDSPPNQLFL